MAVQADFSPSEPEQSIQTAFQEALARSAQLFDCCTPDAYTMRPIPLRHPVAFYEGHLPAFLWNTLFRRHLQRPSFAPQLDHLFERGIDPGSTEAAEAAAIHNWPSRRQIQAYRDRVHQALWRQLNSDDKQREQTDAGEHQHKLLWMALEHELMHQETLLYLIHQLPHSHKRPPSDWRPVPDGLPPTSSGKRQSVPAGPVLLGQPDSLQARFGWDNERPARRVHVDAFDMDTHPVTNGQFLAFVESGGYTQANWWSPSAWQWLQQHQHQHPAFWIPPDSQHGWRLRDMFMDRPLPLTWPVWVTQAEAQAYARFQQADLPTEAEWHRAAYGDRASAEAPYPWGQATPQAGLHGNFNFSRWSPGAVGQHPAGASPYGVQDLIGMSWEWTRSPFSPYPGFSPDPAYPQYSADFFDGQHYAVQGGSCLTASRLLRRSFRNWFYWHYPYAYTGFRCVVREQP